MDLPYLTADLPGVGGVMRAKPEDFFVQELPLYEPSGGGGFIYFECQKVGLTTFEAINRIATELNISRSDIGYAGLKDRHAITQQLFSVPLTETTTEERVMTMEVEGLAPRWADLHENKLKMGHLAGNRFAIRLREVQATDVVKLRPILDRLIKTGLPNYFGEQRFGRDEHRPNDQLGILLLRGDHQAFLDLYLGGPDGRGDVAHARSIYEGDGPAAALEVWPENIRAERKVLAKLVNTNDPAKAVNAVDRKLRRLYESAAQSKVFNAIVADRVRDGLVDQLVEGDAVAIHREALRTGGGFIVEDAAAEQERCTNWEISPTAPMPGKKERPPAAGEAAQREAVVLEQLGLTRADFGSMPGERRPLRVQPLDTKLSSEVTEDGQTITVAFSLPAGSFATTLMRELMKPDAT
jgi:tRNA pseudouridine13 synthase